MSTKLNNISFYPYAQLPRELHQCLSAFYLEMRQRMKSPLSPYLPFYFETQATAYLIELIEICDSFDQLSKIAILADFLISPDGINRALIFASIEQVRLHLRSIPSIGAGELDPGKPCPGCMGFCGACSKGREEAATDGR